VPLFNGATSALNGKELANAPRFTFTGTINYKIDLPGGDDINLRWNSNYRTHVWFDATNDPYNQQSQYWLSNFNAEYEARQGWTAGVFIRNVFEKKYQLTSSDISSPFGFLEPVYGQPRMYGLSLSYHY